MSVQESVVRLPVAREHNGHPDVIAPAAQPGGDARVQAAVVVARTQNLYGAPVVDINVQRNMCETGTMQPVQGHGGSATDLQVVGCLMIALDQLRRDGLVERNDDCLAVLVRIDPQMLMIVHAARQEAAVQVDEPVLELGRELSEWVLCHLFLLCKSCVTKSHSDCSSDTPKKCECLRAQSVEARSGLLCSSFVGLCSFQLDVNGRRGPPHVQRRGLSTLRSARFAGPKQATAI